MNRNAAITQAICTSRYAAWTTSEALPASRDEDDQTNGLDVIDSHQALDAPSPKQKNASDSSAARWFTATPPLSPCSATRPLYARRCSKLV